MIDLFQGDCLEMLSQIPDQGVDLVLTDIPFNVSRDNNFKTMKDRNGRNGIDFGEWDKDFDVKTIAAIVPKIKPGGSFFLFHAFEQYSEVRAVLEESGLICKDKIIWEKTNPMPRNRDRRYIGNIEMASWYVKPGGKWTFNRQSDIYDGCVCRYPSESGGGFKRYHPCQKNLAMMEQLLMRHSNEGDVVLDPFLGGGTTGVACVNTGRKFIGIEKDPAYFKIASERIQAAQPECQCPFGGDESDDCAGCAESADYHFENGECVARRAENG